MSLMSFLGGAASLFGGSSGSKSTGVQSSTTKAEQAATGSETKTGTATQNQSSTGTSTTNGKTTQTGTSTGKESSSTTGTTTNYSSDVLAALDSMLLQQLGAGGAGGNANSALTDRLKQVQALAAQPGFDVAGYAKSVTDASAVAGQNDLDSRINGILSATGSSEGGNSMSALLGAKLRGEEATRLAGVNAQATMAGQQLADAQQVNITNQIGSLTGDINNQLANLLNAAKGGAQATTGTATGTSSQTQSQTGTTNQTTNESLKTDTTQKESQQTDQTGLTQSNSATNTKTKAKEGEKDLFNTILDKFTQSAVKA